MRTCPHCDGHIPEQENRCPSCGRYYWEPDQPSAVVGTPSPHEEKKGCLTFFLVPIATAAVTVVFLIAAGFFMNMLFHFESNQIKIIWTAGSVLLGFILFHLINRYKGHRDKGGN